MGPPAESEYAVEPVGVAIINPSPRILVIKVLLMDIWVEIILANGSSVDFSYIVQDDDVISVYPVFESLDITPLLRLRPEALRCPVFILDANLGRRSKQLVPVPCDLLDRRRRVLHLPPTQLLQDVRLELRRRCFLHHAVASWPAW